jgi:protein-disulfide isomerase
MTLITDRSAAALTDDDHVVVVGDAAMMVTALLYGDYEDTLTRDVHSLLGAYTQTRGSAIRIVYRHLPDVDRHPHAYAAALAAETAAVQGAFAPMHALLMEQPLGLGRDALLDYASDLNLDVIRFEAELRGRICVARIWKHMQRADAAGIDTPPAVLLDGRRVVAPAGPSSLIGALERALATELDAAPGAGLDTNDGAI